MIRRAFTLLEIILAIALVALVASVTASMLVFDANAITARSPESVFHKAVKRARAESFSRGREMLMRFDASGTFVIYDKEDSTQIAEIPIAPKETLENFENDPFLKIEFFVRPTVILENPDLDFPEEPIRTLCFCPDSTMTPFYARFTYKSGEVNKVELDVFSAEQIEVDEKK